ncbi:STAS domain-containing protein [Streptomyces sp. NPDC096136]|uniref:STAS domain-containing protein n=1 Tax=Streptomyces sp. NPDC096136 TaxID=3366076 RepID=UPI0038142F18
MTTLGIQRCGATVLACISGHLDDETGTQLQRALEGVTGDERDLMVDVHFMTSMDADGLLHLLDLHRRAELLGLRVLVVGWQPRPQYFMADVAGIPGPGTATGERFALAGFRRLIEQRAQRARNLDDFTAGWLPRS